MGRPGVVLSLCLFRKVVSRHAQICDYPGQVDWLSNATFSTESIFISCSALVFVIDAQVWEGLRAAPDKIFVANAALPHARCGALFRVRCALKPSCSCSSRCTDRILLALTRTGRLQRGARQAARHHQHRLSRACVRACVRACRCCCDCVCLSPTKIFPVSTIIFDVRCSRRADQPEDLV
jgi:hypothetical protein